MRTTGATIAVVLAISCVALGQTPATADHLSGPCDFHRGAEETIKHFSKRRIICAVDRFGPVPGGAARAVCIARRESGLDPTATSEPEGIYRGLYQHDRALWPGRYERHTRPVWELSRRALNGRTNAIVTIRMVFALGTWRAAGWPPKDC